MGASVSDYGIRVVVDPAAADAGLRKVRQGLTETERSAMMVQRAVTDMGGALGAVGRGTAGGGLTTIQRDAQAATRDLKNLGAALNGVGRAAALKQNLDRAALGGRTLQQELAPIPNQMARIERSGVSAATKIRSAFAVLGIGLVVKKAVGLIDTYGNLQNKLRLVTSGSADLRNVTAELFAISNSTRQSFEGTATVFARVSRATEEMGLSQRDTLDFTKSLNQAVASSGPTSAEASNALIQLSQALASGTLRGDEFRSVSEQLPEVLNVLKESLGKTGGELKKMADEGKITSRIIIDSFRKASGDIDAKFGKTVPTIGQAFTVLGNKMLEALGKFDEATGFTEKFVAVIQFLGDHLDALGKALKFVALVIGTRVATAIIGVAVPAFFKLGAAIFTGTIPAVHALGAAIRLNPIGALISVLQIGIPAVLAFGSSVEDSTASVEGLNESTWFGVAIGGVAKAALGKYTDEVVKHREEVEKLVRANEIRMEVERRNKAARKQLADMKKAELEALDAGLAAADKFNQTQREAVENLGRTSVQLARLSALRAADQIRQKEGVNLTDDEIDRMVRLAEHRAREVDAHAKWEASRERAKASREQTISGLRSLQAQMSPLVAAQQEVAEATTLLADAERRHLITGPARIALLKQVTQSYAEQLDPVGAALAKIREETSLLVFNTEARKRDIEFRKLQKDLEGEKGGALTSDESGSLRNQLAVLNLIKDAKAGIAAFAKEERAQRAVRDKASAKEAADAQRLQDTFDARLASMRSEAAVQALITQGRIVDAEVLRVTNEFKAQGVKLTDEQTAAIRSAAEAQKLAGDAAADAGKRGFDAWNALAQAINAAGGEGKTFEQRMRAVLTALLRIAAVQGLIGAGANAQVAGALGGLIPGFAHGGSFRVGGSGGTDSQPVMFMASPNETVTIQTPQQRAQAPVAAAPAPNVQVQLVDDIGGVVDSYFGSPAGARRLTQQIDRNISAYRRRFK